MMFMHPAEVRHITSIGGGPIGAGWSAHFLARGYHVTSYLHDLAEKPAFIELIDVAWRSLTELGLAADASRSRLQVVDKLDLALAETQFVQESAPENLALKQSLYQHLGDVLPASVVVASSTSGLLMSDIQAHCASPERTVIGHPFNPPYLLPLVEIVGGRQTDPDAVSWAAAFYAAAGKAPLRMKKEVPGFVATRLQEALWREALHMVANGEASPADIDTALINGPAPRMAVQGQCMAFHVACGAGGMATNLDQFGPALALPWSRLQAPPLTAELRQRMVDGCHVIAGDRPIADLITERDRQIVAVLRALRRTG